MYIGLATNDNHTNWVGEMSIECAYAAFGSKFKKRRLPKNHKAPSYKTGDIIQLIYHCYFE